MAKPLDLSALPARVARFTASQVATRRFASIEEVLQAAGVEALLRAQTKHLVDIWIKLASPQVALNSPNAGKHLRMTHSPIVPWDWSVERMLSEAVPDGVKHLIFNCHGIPTGGKADFPAPHLSIGTAIHPGNVDAFSKLSSRVRGEAS